MLAWSHQALRSLFIAQCFTLHYQCGVHYWTNLSILLVHDTLCQHGKWLEDDSNVHIQWNSKPNMLDTTFKNLLVAPSYMEDPLIAT